MAKVTPLSTPTTNYGWAKPTVGGDPDVWGGMINTDLDGIDSTVFGMLPKTGGALTGALTPSQTAGIVGTTAANNANAGAVGEYVTASQGSPQAMTTGVNKNIVSISLTAGDWDVGGNVWFALSVGGTYVGLWITPTSAGNPSVVDFTGQAQLQHTTATITQPILATGDTRILIAATTTVYLVAAASFSSGTSTGVGTIRARRAR